MYPILTEYFHCRCATKRFRRPDSSKALEYLCLNSSTTSTPWRKDIETYHITTGVNVTLDHNRCKYQAISQQMRILSYITTEKMHLYMIDKCMEKIHIYTIDTCVFKEA